MYEFFWGICLEKGLLGCGVASSSTLLNVETSPQMVGTNFPTPASSVWEPIPEWCWQVSPMKLLVPLIHAMTYTLTQTPIALTWTKRKGSKRNNTWGHLTRVRQEYRFFGVEPVLCRLTNLTNLNPDTIINQLFGFTQWSLSLLPQFFLCQLGLVIVLTSWVIEGSDELILVTHLA